MLSFTINNKFLTKIIFNYNDCQTLLNKQDFKTEL